MSERIIPAIEQIDYIAQRLKELEAERLGRLQELPVEPPASDLLMGWSDPWQELIALYGARGWLGEA